MKDYKTASPDRYRLLKGFALENRKNQTLAEQVLWNHIRAEQLDVKVLRQHIIGDYIVDFLIPDVCLIIEVDGPYHAKCWQMQEDEQREETLNRMGYRVIRFTNEEVLYDTDNVLETIIKEIESYEQ
ncbi:MAG: endonuclease domain-containing protein [Bacteroidaceae bacterium]|nr:endonuclease domain-containing protein [Bacteroidaceae bacterium]